MNGLSGRVERASEEDLPEIISVQREAFGTVAEMLGNSDIQPLRETVDELRAQYAQGTVLKYVTDDGSIIGSVRGCIREGNVCAVGKLSVKPSFRNRGVATALLAGIEQCYGSADRYTLFTSMLTPNTARMYARVGYEVTRRETMNGLEMVFMDKSNPRAANVK